MVRSIVRVVAEQTEAFYRYLVPDFPCSEDGIALAASEEGTSAASDLELPWARRWSI